MDSPDCPATAVRSLAALTAGQATDTGHVRFPRPGSKRKKRRQRAPSGYITGELRATSESSGGAACPISKTHKRMQDCHDQWHSLTREYHHPGHFRRELNTIIQSLRNVTFILQSEKSNIEGFDSWYEPWREKMRASRVMRWVVESRNRVVKQGDLDAKSEAKAALIAAYWAGDPPKELTKIIGPDGDQKLKLSIDVPPAASTKEQVHELASLPEFFVREGYIELTRRWVDKALPDRELADACAEAYGFMAVMLDDLHEKLGIDHGVAFGSPDGGYLVVERLPHGRLPCMVPREYAVRRLRLSNGATDVGGNRYSFSPNTKQLNKSIKKYGLSDPPPEGWDSVTSMADWCMRNARTILKKDRWHGWYVLLYKGNRQVATEALEARDRPDKMVLMRELAAAIERSGIDGLVEVGDTWQGRLVHDEQGFIVPPALQDDRREALSVVAEDAYGNRRYLISPYRRVGRRIEFDGDPIDLSDTMFANNLQPIRDAWIRMGFKAQQSQDQP
ncbi:hypothetical protein ABUL04_04695 [Micromonospora harpali]|uniref:Uncharacterized protein n=1 Tax=Micromonospora harpali TaxID=1490225 RepID=A0ABW1HJ71_9ACTN